MNEKIEKTLNLLPLNPGVYIMKNSAGEIIYVGKSRSLKKRVNSYLIAYTIMPKLTLW